ncbi:MAG: hypothetical protein QM820_55780 [Minicystis sp.]
MKNGVRAESKRPRRGWRIARALRVLAFGAFVSLCTGLLAARSVYGDAKSMALSLGHELGRMDDVGSKRPLRLNGEPIYVASTTEDMRLTDVLDRMEASCLQNSVGMPVELESLSESLKKKFPEATRGRLGRGIIREERADSGMIACFARADGREAGGLPALVSRIGELVETGDLGALGHLRYVFAETTRSGRTHVVAAWTDGSFNIHKLVPAGGDAPGSDARDAPRPPDAARMLSVDAEGVPYSIRVYDSGSSPTEIIAFYDAEMTARGWEPVLGVPGDGKDSRVFNRQGVDLLLFADHDGNRTMVSIIEMRSK